MTWIATGLPTFELSTANCTVPPGVPPPGLVTVAVKLTVPGALGLAEETTLVVVGA